MRAGQGSRFTAWFSSIERKALEDRALKDGTPTNYVVRLAVRRYLGREALKKAADEVMDVMSNQ